MSTKRHFWTKNKKIAAAVTAIAVAFGGSVAFYKVNEYNSAIRDFQDANERIVKTKESLKSTDSDLNKALKLKDTQVKDKNVLKTLKDTNKKAQEVLNAPVEEMKSALDEIRGQTTELNALADAYQVAADALRDQTNAVHKSRFDKSKDNLVSLIKTANDLKGQDHSLVIDQAKVENLKKELNSANKLITTIKSIVDNYSTHADSADKIQAALKKAIDELNSAERKVEAAVYNGYSGGYGEAGTGGTGGGGTGGGGMSDDQKAQLRDNLKNNIDWGDSANQHDKDAL